MGVLIGADFYGFIAMSDELAAALRAVGEDPASYNRLSWPIGASQHATGKFLLHSDELNAIIGDDTSSSVTLVIGAIDFDYMFIRNPRPVLVSEGSGVIWEIEIVDVRWTWKDNHASASGFFGYNVSLDDRASLYDSTENGTDTEYTARTAILDAIGYLGNTSAEVWDIPDNADLKYEGELRDLMVRHLPAAEVIDRLLASAGYVLAAYPNKEYRDESAGYRYRAIRIEDGLVDVRDEIEAFTDDLIGGGLYSPDNSYDGVSKGAGKLAGDGKVGWLSVEVPGIVQVCFPRAANVGSVYVRNDEDEDEDGIHWVTERFYELTSSEGFPDGVDGNDQTTRVYGSMWARITDDGVVGNGGQLSTCADHEAARFYARYKAGCGQMIFRGFLKLMPWAGAQIVEWIMTPSGPFTRTKGLVDCSLYGHAYSKEISALDILTIGGVHCFPRPDGGILLDAEGALSGKGPYAGRITVVNDGTPTGYNATYDAEALANPEISVDDASPIDRIIAGGTIDWFNRSVDDRCILLIDDDATVHLLAMERCKIELCDNDVYLADLDDVASGLSPTASDLLAYVGGEWTGQSFSELGLVTDDTGVVRLDVDTTEVEWVNTAGADKVLYSFTIPADTLSTNRTVRVCLGGLYKNNYGSNRNLTLEVTYGSTEIWKDTGVAVSNADWRAWRMEFDLTADGATNAQKLNGSFYMAPTGAATTGYGDLAGIATAILGAFYGTAAEDSTGALAIEVRSQHQTADAAISIKFEQAVVTLV